MKGDFILGQVKINGKKRQALVWIGCCDKPPSDAQLLKEAKAKGLDRVVVTCRPSWEKVTAVAFRRDGDTLKQEAKQDIALGSHATLIDCTYDCPGGDRQDFNVWAKRGETPDHACRRKLAERVGSSKASPCTKLRAREID